MDKAEKLVIKNEVNEFLTKKIEEIEARTGTTNWQRKIEKFYQDLRCCQGTLNTMRDDYENLKKLTEEVRKNPSSPIVSNTIVFVNHLKEMGFDLAEPGVSEIVKTMINGLSYEAWKQKQVEGWGRND